MKPRGRPSARSGAMHVLGANARILGADGYARLGYASAIYIDRLSPHAPKEKAVLIQPRHIAEHTSCRVLGAVEAALAMEASWLNWAIVLMCGSHGNDGYKRSNKERWKLT